MNAVEHWKYQLAGTFEECLKWQDARTGESNFGLRVDYFGGKQTVMVDEGEYDSFESRLTSGVECRISGDILLSNGNPKLRVADLTFQGDPKHKPLSDEERVKGCLFIGVGEVAQKRQWKGKNGLNYELSLRSVGGSVVLLLPLSVYEPVPETGFVLVQGKIDSILTRSWDGKQSTVRTVPQFAVSTIAPCDFSGRGLMDKTVKKEAA